MTETPRSSEWNRAEADHSRETALMLDAVKGQQKKADSESRMHIAAAGNSQSQKMAGMKSQDDKAKLLGSLAPMLMQLLGGGGEEKKAAAPRGGIAAESQAPPGADQQAPTQGNADYISALRKSRGNVDEIMAEIKRRGTPGGGALDKISIGDREGKGERQLMLDIAKDEAGLTKTQFNMINAELTQKRGLAKDKREERTLKMNVMQQMQVERAYQDAKNRLPMDDVVKFLKDTTDDMYYGDKARAWLSEDLMKLGREPTRREMFESHARMAKAHPTWLRPKPIKGTSPTWKVVADKESSTGWSYRNLNDPTAPLMHGAEAPSGGEVFEAYGPDGKLVASMRRGGATKNQAGKEYLKTKEAETNLAISLNVSNRVLGEITNADINMSGFTGRFLDTVKSQAVTLSHELRKSTGLDFSAGHTAGMNMKAKDGSNELEKSALKTWAGHSAKMRSLLTYYAYAMITSLQGSRPSNEDIKNATIMIGSAGGTATQVKAGLMELGKTLIRKHESKMRSFQSKGEKPYDARNLLLRQRVSGTAYGYVIPNEAAIKELEFWKGKASEADERAEFNAFYWDGAAEQLLGPLKAPEPA